MRRLLNLLICTLVLSLLVQTPAQANPSVDGMLALHQSDALQSIVQARQWLSPGTDVMSLTQKTAIEVNPDQVPVTLALASGTMLDMAFDYLALAAKDTDSLKVDSAHRRTVAQASPDDNSPSSSTTMIRDTSNVAIAMPSVHDSSAKVGEFDEVMMPPAGMVHQPASMGLMGLGALALLTRPRKKRSK